MSANIPDPLLLAGIYFIWWWIAFLLVLPIGVRNLDEAGASGVAAGSERAAPAIPKLRQKAVWATGLAFVFLLATAALIIFDPINLRGQPPG